MTLGPGKHHFRQSWNIFKRPTSFTSFLKTIYFLFSRVTRRNVLQIFPRLAQDASCSAFYSEALCTSFRGSPRRELVPEAGKERIILKNSSAFFLHGARQHHQMIYRTAEFQGWLEILKTDIREPVRMFSPSLIHITNGNPMTPDPEWPNDRGGLVWFHPIVIVFEQISHVQLLPHKIMFCLMLG